MPNVTAEWLTVMVFIWEVPDSYLGLETGYHD
jgi:hypothetical protein